MGEAGNDAARAALRRIAEANQQTRARLEEWERELDRREQAIAGERDARDAELEELRGRVRELEEQLRAAPEPQPEPEPVVQRTPTRRLDDLERIAAEAQARGDARADEQVLYLPLLREHAAIDGTLPPQFDELVASVFGPFA